MLLTTFDINDFESTLASDLLYIMASGINDQMLP